MAVSDWSGMEWAAILTAGATVMGMFGAGIGVLLTRADKNKLQAIERKDKERADEMARQEELRDELQVEVERRFDMQRQQMDELRKTLVDQAAMLRRYEDLLDDYGIHVNKLEALMRAAGLSIPPFEPQDRKAHRI